ncbi:sulfite exporter TauE/SafE family protein [Ferrigenium sp. UT5]|uniref:sulfite exporter TauE/SafE family protein n=1 Tax=Ferrigenium sp. UT5 TaxID=3242105 RepID=UPI0035532CBD
MEWALAYLLLGAIAGFLGGLFGIGGGTILVPVFLWLFEAQHLPPDHTMHLALGTSMAVILFTSLASLRKHHQHGAVDWRVLRHITPGILSGTALGATSAALVSPHFLMVFFALFVYFAATQILLDFKPHAGRELPGIAGMSLFGTFTGWLSSLVSIGGGTVVIPFLIWCNVPLRRAIGTASAIGFPIAVGGTFGYILIGSHLPALPEMHLGFVYLPALFWAASASVLTAPLGAQTAHRIQVPLLRKGFALLLLGLATKLLLKAIV